MQKTDILRKIFNDTDHNLDEVVKLGSRGCFDFVDTGSQKLVVTIGDSWTYGYRLSEEIQGDEQEKEQYRIANTFGSYVSQARDADYLNISIPAINNLWIMEKYCALTEIVDELAYDMIEVILVMTEYGREFHTDFDIAPELNALYPGCNNVQDLAKAFSEYIVSKINDKPHDKVELTMCTNYVDYLYPSNLLIKRLDKSWLEVLTDRIMDTSCLVVGSWVISKFEHLPEYNNTIDSNQLLTDLNQLVDCAYSRLDTIYASGYNHKEGYGHPTSNGHRKFADYYLMQPKRKG